MHSDISNSRHHAKQIQPVLATGEVSKVRERRTSFVLVASQPSPVVQLDLLQDVSLKSRMDSTSSYERGHMTLWREE